MNVRFHAVPRFGMEQKRTTPEKQPEMILYDEETGTTHRIISTLPVPNPSQSGYSAMVETVVQWGRQIAEAKPEALAGIRKTIEKTFAGTDPRLTAPIREYLDKALAERESQENPDK